MSCYDRALMRPGRFDVEIKVHFPDLAGRVEVFQYYLGDFLQSIH